MVAAGGLGAVVVTSAYLFTNNTSRTKLSHANYDILRAIGEKCITCRYPMLIGADWQTDLQFVMGFFDAARMKVMHASVSLGSCISKTTKGLTISCVDYFVM